MTKKKAAMETTKAVRDEQSVSPDVLPCVGIEFHNPATCTCENCIELRRKMAQKDRQAA